MPSENVLSSEQVGVQPILARHAAAHRRQLLLAATLLFLVLSFGTLLRFINLERRVYWHDEVYTSLRSSGHRASEAVDELFLGEEFSADTLLNYQNPERDRGLRDIIESLIAEEPQ